MELENKQVVDGTRPKNRLSLKKSGKWLGFDTKFDTNLGQGLIVADQPSSFQTRGPVGNVNAKRPARGSPSMDATLRTTWILAMVTAAFLYRR